MFLFFPLDRLKFNFLIKNVLKRHSNEFYVPGKRTCRKLSIAKILNENRQLKNAGILTFVNYPRYGNTRPILLIIS